MRTPGTGLSRIAFALLVLGVVVLIVAAVWGGSVYPGYDHVEQYLSELGATGAVTGPAVSGWGFVPNGLLYAAFCLIAAWLLRGSALAVLGCLFMACNGFGMAGAGVYPCDFECPQSDMSTTALLHDVYGGLGYLGAVVGIVLMAIWARKSAAPWLAPLGAVAAIVSFVGFSIMIADIGMRGLFQRSGEVAVAGFMLALGWALMKGLRAGSPDRP